MKFFTESLPLSDKVFCLLRDLIKERTGIFFEDSKKEILADKLNNRVLENGFNSFIDYYYLLKYDQASAEEWNQLIDIITVKETYFWREFDHFEAVRKYILPSFIRLNKNKPFRVWCAACSTGEEPLTFLMALDQHGWLEKINIELLASDASIEALNKAKEGIYKERSFRSTPDYIKLKYFSLNSNNLWKVDNRLHSMISWKQINLTVPEQVKSAGIFDLIICRNVFIYFKDDTIKMITDNFYDILSENSYLIVGVSESLFRITEKFELIDFDKTFVYRKI